MALPPKNHTHLWNDLHEDERSRLMPYMIEHQMMIIWQEKQKAIDAHRAHMKAINEKLDILNDELKSITK